jgi:hypothetical protein
VLEEISIVDTKSYSGGSEQERNTSKWKHIMQWYRMYTDFTKFTVFIIYLRDPHFVFRTVIQVSAHYQITDIVGTGMSSL